MTKIFIILVLFFSIVCSLTLYAEEKEENFFPLLKGSYWIYTGTVKYEGKEREICEKNLTWKSEITDVIKNKDITLAVFKGYPSDLSWYNDDTQRGDYLIVKKGNTQYYLFYEVKQEIIKNVKEGKDISSYLNDEENLILDLPLTPDKTFPKTDRDDPLYAWCVESSDDIQLDIKGYNTTGKVKKYKLVYRSNSDYRSIDYVPGLGITGYEYFHHGTTSECHITLSEYYKGTK